MNKGFKTCLVMLLCIVCLLISPWAYAEMYEAFVTDVAGENVFRYASNEETVFVQEGSSICRYNAETLQLESSVDVTHEILHIAVGKDGLYVNLPGRIAQLDDSGDIAREWALPEGLGDEVYQFYVTDECFVLFENVSQMQFIGNGTNLWCLEKNSGKAVPSQNAVSVYAASNAPDGRMLLLQYSDMSYGLNFWDPASDTVDSVAKLTGLPEFILADGQEGAYCFEGDRVYYIDFETGLSTDVCRIAYEVAAACSGLERAGDYLLTEDINEHRLIAMKKIEQSQEHSVLNLVNLSVYEGKIRDAIRRFETENPGVRIQYTQMTNDQLNAALLAQDSGIDILPVTSYTIDSYCENGVLADLTQNGKMKENLAAWRSFNGMITEDKAVYALPVFVTVDALWGNVAILEDCGVDTDEWNPADMSWSEFYDFCVNLQREYGVVAYTEGMRFPEPVMQYIASFNGDVKAIRFDTEEFYAIVRIIKQKWDEGILPFSKHSIVEDGVLELSGISGAAIMNNDFEKLYLLPRIDGRNAYPTGVEMMGVNARSDRLDLALEFMACLASVDVQQNEDIASKLKDMSMYNAQHLNELGYIFTEESFVLWDEASSSMGSTGIVQGVFGLHLGDQMEAYLNGEIDEYKLARSLDEKIRMIQFG